MLRSAPYCVQRASFADGGEWLHFDYVPGAPEIRRGTADYTGRLCVIGSELDEERIAALFGVNEK